MTIDSDVRVTREGDLLRITLVNPDVRNAQTPATWRRLAEAADAVDADVRFVVLSGEGSSFSAGLDRRMLTSQGVPGEASLWDLARQDDSHLDEMIREAQRAFTWWRQVPAVTIACVQGHAIGAGFQLALACDLMIVAPDAQLAMRETSLGLVPDLTGTGTLVERVGYARALEICVTGRSVGATDAVQWGLANAVVDQQDWPGALEALLAPMRSAPARAVSEVKALLQGATPGPSQWQREREAQGRRLRDLLAHVGSQG